jgi:tetratricopeptide (TPR) repeat protein
LAAELGDRAAEARALWNLQLVNLFQNKTAEAIDYGEKSLSIARELDLREQMGYVLGDLGWAYTVACQFEKAEESLDEGTRIWRELGNKPMQTNNLNLLLFGAWFSGRDAQVLNIAEEALQLSTSINEVWNQASARNFQGLVWLDAGEIDKGLDALEDSIRLAAQGNPFYETWYRAMLCQAYADLGAADLGQDLYRRHRLPNADIPSSPMRTSTLICYAQFEIASGELDTAEATLADCVPDAPPWEAMLRLARCRLALARGDYSNGLSLADSAVAFTRENSLGRYLPEDLFLKGKMHFLQGDSAAAKGALDQARLAAENAGSRRLLWQITALLADLESDPELSAALKAEARLIVQSIADHITRPDLRAAFLASASVSAVLA